MKASLSECVRRGLPVIPVLLPGAGAQPMLPLFLTQYTWVDLRAGLSAEGLDCLEWGVTGRKPRRGDEEAEAEAPYPVGLGADLSLTIRRASGRERICLRQFTASRAGSRYVGRPFTASRAGSRLSVDDWPPVGLGADVSPKIRRAPSRESICRRRFAARWAGSRFVVDHWPPFGPGADLSPTIHRQSGWEPLCRSTIERKSGWEQIVGRPLVASRVGSGYVADNLPSVGLGAVLTQ